MQHKTLFSTNYLCNILTNTYLIMKKIFYTLLTVSIIFAACKKEEENSIAAPTVGIVGGAWITDSEEITMHAVVSMGGIVVMDTTITEIETNQDSMETVIQKFWDNGDFNAWDNNNNLVDIGTWVQSGTTVTITTDTVIVGEIISVTKTNLVHTVEGTESFTEDGLDYDVDYTFTANHTRDENGFTTNNTNQRKENTSWINKRRLMNIIKR